MTKQVSEAELRAHLADLLDDAYDGDDPVVVERKGKPLAVLISPELYKRYQQEVMARFRQTVREFRQLNVDSDPDEGFRAVTELVEEVRQEQYDREQQSDSSGH